MCLQVHVQGGQLRLVKRSGAAADGDMTRCLGAALALAFEMVPYGVGIDLQDFGDFLRRPAGRERPFLSKLSTKLRWSAGPTVVALPPRYVHMAEEDGLVVQVEFVALRLDLHGIANGLA